MKKLALDLVGVLEVLDDRVAGYRQEVLSELIKQIMPELESRGFTVEDLLYSIIDYIAADPKLRYHFGQMVKQGQIVGMEYYPPGSYRASQHGEGWIYWILLDQNADDTESFGESGIRALKPEELHTLIQDEIQLHTTRVAALKEQLEQGGEYGKP